MYYKKSQAWLGLLIFLSALSLSSAATPTPTPTPTATPSPTPAMTGPNFTVQIQEDPVHGNPPGSVSYHVKYGSSHGNYATTVNIPAPANSTDFTNFPLGTIYMVVTAYNALGESGNSPEVQVNVLQVPQTPGAPVIINNGGLANISTRAVITANDGAEIGGFILGAPETVAVRALGPSLSERGVEGTIPGTSLELHDRTGALIASNKGWENDPNAEQLRNLNLDPESPLESALIAELGAGQYTAVVRGSTPDETGIGLVEVYQLTP